ncbi:MAG: haloacid dehalogenase type II [Vicinamibacterales bacterium]|jgi:2-haloacid dehalogenase|nr:haloacid dehalogenase type II [Vicinamibacterales bacterium]HJN44653.1 haloacid dehalogenase type II [Vicinamibacterales bacterium]|tara:strand:- start:1311 stop:2144 length:834 start_codon:yes stop_codon:yes gene_type:complete
MIITSLVACVREHRFLAAAVIAGLFAAVSEAPGRAQPDPDRIAEVKAMTFDVFGTVVDWRSSIIREGEQLSARTGLEVDWPAFADAWRGGYGPAMRRVTSGELPWTKIDDLHRMILDGLIPEFGLTSLDEAARVDLNRVWHRLAPWPDTVGGLTRLRGRFVLASLSNGNVGLLVNMAKHAGLPWDAVLSAELAHQYKTHPDVYLTAADLLGLAPEEVMMVAAHKGDLRAAAALGFKTAYVPRPLEYGPDREIDTSPDPSFDVTATDFHDLADRLGLP